MLPCDSVPLASNQLYHDNPERPARERVGANDADEL